jgi:hypothetical protein
MKMKKLFLLAAISAATVFTTVSAQKRTTARSPLFSVGLDVSAPVGDAKNFYGFGFGGSGKIEIPATQSFSITVTAGYTSIYLKDNIKNTLHTFGYDSKPAGYIPIKAGGKYYIVPEFYVEGEIGAAIGAQRSSLGGLPSLGNTLTGHGTAFAYAPGIGTSLALGGRSAIDIGARYEGWSQNGQLNQGVLRVAYKF